MSAFIVTKSQIQHTEQQQSFILLLQLFAIYNAEHAMLQYDCLVLMFTTYILASITNHVWKQKQSCKLPLKKDYIRVTPVLNTFLTWDSGH